MQPHLSEVDSSTFGERYPDVSTARQLTSSVSSSGHTEHVFTVLSVLTVLTCTYSPRSVQYSQNDTSGAAVKLQGHGLTDSHRKQNSSVSQVLT